MRCHYCGRILPSDTYIRSGSFYFCAMRAENNGWSAECFSNWAYSVYPKTLANRMVREISTPEATA